MRDNVDTRGVMKIPRKHTGEGHYFRALFRIFREHPPPLALIIFMNYGATVR